MHRLIWTFLLPALLLFATAATAATLPPAVAERARTATVQRFPDADTVLLSDRQSIVYQPDATAVTVDDYYLKILTEKGRRDNRTLRLYFHTAYNRVEVPLLEIIRPDGSVEAVDVAANSKIAVDSSQMQSNIYDPNTRILSVSIPSLQIGDTLHTVIRDTHFKARMPGIWCDVIALQSTDPILEYRVEIDAPASRPLASVAIKDPVPGSVRSSERRDGDRIHYQWVATDVPQIFPEPDMPPVYRCAQRLLVSTARDWPEISRWYDRLCRPRLAAVSPELKQAVAELTAGAKTPDEKIARLFQFVSQNIRYMGLTPEEEAPGYEPHDVALTFRNRYGVCRDKAALLTAMLRLAGVPAYPTLFYAGEPKDPEVPNNYFNHAITVAEPEPGRYVLMDPTYETTTELLPAGEADMSYLVARPEGDRLRTSPTVPASANLLKIDGDAEITRDGRLAGRIAMEFSGTHDQVYRGMLSHRTTAAARRQFFAAMLKAAVPGAELGTFSVSPEDIRDMTRPLVVRLDYTAPDALAAAGGLIPFDPPLTGGSFGLVNWLLAGSAGLEQRKFPLKIYSTCAVSEQLRLKLPPGVAPALLPHPDLRFTSPALSIRRTSAFADGVLTVNAGLTLDRTTVSPEEYLAMKQLLRQLESVERVHPLFRTDGEIRDPARAFPEDDAVWLGINRRFRLTAADRFEETSAYRLKVLNYAGVKNFSELRLGYHPAAVSLLEVRDARVVDPDGTVHPLAAGEINRMDAPGAGDAPRYAPGKILVVNFPGVKPGSVIEYTVVRHFRSDAGISLTPVFAGRCPILEQRIRLEYADGLAPAQSPVPAGVISEAGALVRRNAPGIPSEAGAAPPEFHQPMLRIAAGSPVDYGRRLLAALNRAAADQPAAAAKAREITAGAADETARILAVRNFVARHIREAGAPFTELGLAAISPADRTLADGYGNRADRAVLIKSMLDALNIPARLIAASDAADTPENRRMLIEYPDLGRFDRLLVAAGSGTPPLYLNSGSEYAAPGALHEAGRLAFDPADGSFAPLTPRQPTVDDAAEYDIALAADGSARITVTDLYSGRPFDAAHRQQAEFTPENRRRHFQERAAALAQSARIVGEPAVDFTGSPGRIALTVELPDFAPANDGRRQVELPEFSRLTDLFRTADGSRKTPFLRTAPNRVRLVWRLTWPDGWRVIGMPEDVHEQSRLETVSIRHRMLAHGVEITAEAETRPGLTAAADYAALAALQRRLTQLSRRIVVLADR